MATQRPAAAHAGRRSTAGHGASMSITAGPSPPGWAPPIAMVAIMLGGIALVVRVWPLFWVGVALLVVSLIVTKVLQVMGHGAD